VASFESQAVEGDRAAVLLHRSHAADLTVIGQARQHREDRQFIDRMLLHNARPTLLVPEGAANTHLGERVLVAWDDSAACARAVADAVPVLAKAREVRLRIWRRAGEAGGTAIAQRLDEVIPWLSRQGVVAEGRVELATRAIGDEILHAADALGSDLIVMGTYSHSRWTERLLGGASQTALQCARVPLWMSH
jgi:nucleotide-binding universal stress UspA family protein